MSNSGAAPTGCFKCGRPGHWSRDCPSSAPNPNSDDSAHKSTTAASNGGGSGGAFKPIQKPIEKPKKVPKTRPKLTPELLLSDDGLGYVLRHFPRSFKYRGCGHEASDLGNLINMYSQWHSHLLPYYSFDQFVHKVEQVAATKNVKVCIRDLREKVARGGDPTKIHEESDVPDGQDMEREQTMIPEESNHSPGHPSSEKHDAEDIENEMLDEIFKNTTEEPASEVASAADTPSVGNTEKEIQIEGADNVPSCSNKKQVTVTVTDEQKARIEANRLKALEKAASRIEASRLKAALEKAAADTLPSA